MDLSALSGQIWTGLYSACFLFLCAAGLTLVFGAGDFFNFAHGAFFMLGGYFSFSLFTYLNLQWPWCAFVAVGAVALVAALIYRLLVGILHIRSGSFTVQLLATYGLLLVLSELVRWIWGSGYIAQAIPGYLAHPVNLPAGALSGYQLTIIGVTLLVGSVSIVLIHQGRWGRLVRATINDTRMVAHLGGTSERVVATLFVAGAALAGMGGALALPILAMTPYAGDELIIGALIVTVIGGRGNLWGAAVAALIVSEAVALGNVLVPRVAPAIPYVIALGVLASRPMGLFRPLVSDEQVDRA